MEMNEIIMCVMAVGAAIGGLDRILGNKFGYGEKFENGFRLLGPIGLSMAGIICMAPVLSMGLGKIVGPISNAIHMDPSIWGSILSMDMGGYLMAVELAKQPILGVYSGIIVAGIFGCTIVYTIPVGLAAIRMEDRTYFTKGILLGFMVMPLAEVFQRMLRDPLEWIRSKTGLSGVTTTALLIGLVSSAPALAMIPKMEKRGKVVTSAFLVFSTGVFGAHLAFTINAQPDILPAMLAAKLTGAVLAIGVSMVATKNLKHAE